MQRRPATQEPSLSLKLGPEVGSLQAPKDEKPPRKNTAIPQELAVNRAFRLIKAIKEKLDRSTHGFTVQDSEAAAALFFLAGLPRLGMRMLDIAQVIPLTTSKFQVLISAIEELGPEKMQEIIDECIQWYRTNSDTHLREMKTGEAFKSIFNKHTPSAAPNTRTGTIPEWLAYVIPTELIPGWETADPQTWRNVNDPTSPPPITAELIMELNGLIDSFERALHDHVQSLRDAKQSGATGIFG